MGSFLKNPVFLITGLYRVHIVVLCCFQQGLSSHKHPLTKIKWWYDCYICCKARPFWGTTSHWLFWAFMGLAMLRFQRFTRSSNHKNTREIYMSEKWHSPVLGLKNQYSTWNWSAFLTLSVSISYPHHVSYDHQFFLPQIKIPNHTRNQRILWKRDVYSNIGKLRYKAMVSKTFFHYRIPCMVRLSLRPSQAIFSHDCKVHRDLPHKVPFLLGREWSCHQWFTNFEAKPKHFLVFHWYMFSTLPTTWYSI